MTLGPASKPASSVQAAPIIQVPAEPEAKVVPVEVPPITVSFVGTGTSDGGGVAPIPDGTVLQTPDGLPNVRANVISPAIALFIRFVNVWLTTFYSLATAAGLFGDKIPGVHDLKSGLMVAALGATIAAGGATVKNAITIFGRLEGKYPLASGSI